MGKLSKYMFAIWIAICIPVLQVCAGTQKKIKLISAGSIAFQRYSYAKKGKVLAYGVQDLVRSVPEIKEIADIEIEEFSNIDASLMTPVMMFNLAMEAWKILKDPEISGVIILHGSETLEETAFMLDLLIDSEKPVVITGAQRMGSDLSVDAAANLLDAARVAIDAESWGRGVLVVFNGTILSGREATKVSASDIDAFKSPYGPVGKVQSGKVLYLRPKGKRFVIETNDVAKKVYLIKMAAGMDGLFLRVAIEGGADGVVIEGFGAGTLTEDNLRALYSAIEKKVPVVIVSRCASGFVDPEQVALFAGKDLAEKGIIFGGDLTGPKARILLMLVLNRTRSPKEIQDYFNRFYTR